MPRLHELIGERREELIDRWRRRIVGVLAPQGEATPELVDSLPFFISELVSALAAHTGGGTDHLPMSSATAGEHGQQRFHAGFNVEGTVREYAVLLDCILELAEEHRVEVSIADARALNRLVAGGMTAAVAVFVREKEQSELRHALEQFAFLAHELRNPLAAAQLALDTVLKQDRPANGAVV
ncbi:MAG: hypothetical protein ACK4N5_19330, partial [Myxococcales bacterium]